MAEFKYARDGTVCSLACGHPHCWSALRSHGCRSPTWSSASSGSDVIGQSNTDEDGLPTLKVLNMMDDYGESPLDLYPSKFGGRATHRRYDSPMNTSSQANVSIRHAGVAGRRGGLSRSADGSNAHQRMPALRSVEVHEVFDMEDYWDETILARPMYVWMPRQRAKKKNRKDIVQDSTNAENVKKGPELVAVKNLTCEIIPAFGHQPPQQNDTYGTRDKTTVEQWTAAIESNVEIPDKAPFPTGGQPYPNVGLIPHDRRQELINELHQLPKEFLVEIMEKAADLSETGDLIRLVEKYVRMMPRTQQEFLLAVGDVLTQKKLKPDEAMWLSNPQRALPSSTADQAYRLDEAGPGGGRISRRERHSRLSHYAPLPGINVAGHSRPTRARRIYTNVGATVRYTARPFKYDSSVLDFSLGPVLTPPRSRYDRSSRSGQSSLTDFGHVRSDATADSESRQESQGSPFAEFKDYPGGTAIPAIWSGSSSGRLLPKPPAGTPYTPHSTLRAVTAQSETPAVLHEGKKNARDASSDQAQVLEDSSAVNSSSWHSKGDYWDDIRRHALLAAIDEGDEKSHDAHRGNTALSSTEASRLASAQAAGRQGDRKSASPMLLKQESRKTSARSLADSASTHGAEEPPLGAFRPLTGTTHGGSTPDHARSAASNWPQVDEEALLRRDDGADRVPTGDRVKRHVHVPTGEVDAEADTTPPTPTSTAPLVHETPELGEYKVVVAPPMPPPPSPEMQNERMTVHGTYSEEGGVDMNPALNSLGTSKEHESHDISAYAARLGAESNDDKELPGVLSFVNPSNLTEAEQSQDAT